jgi:hypothetical protein
MLRLFFTVTLTVATALGSLSGPALAALPVRDAAKPAAPVVEVVDVPERPRLERGADSRRDDASVRLACENGCGRPAYTRE